MGKGDSVCAFVLFQMFQFEDRSLHRVHENRSVRTAVISLFSLYVFYHVLKFTFFIMEALVP